MNISESVDRPTTFISLPNGADRRREQRLELRRKVEVLPCAEDGSTTGDFVTAELFDCSIHGVALLLKEPLNIKTQLLLKIQLEETQIVLYTVRNCRMHDGQQKIYRIGAEFDTYIAASPQTRRQSIVDALTDLDEPLADAA